MNTSFGSRWSDSISLPDPNPPDNAAGGSYCIPQMTVLTMQISSFLCPSDPMPGSSGTPDQWRRSWWVPATIPLTPA